MTCTSLEAQYCMTNYQTHAACATAAPGDEDHRTHKVELVPELELELKLGARLSWNWSWDLETWGCSYRHFGHAARKDR